MNNKSAPGIDITETATFLESEDTFSEIVDANSPGLIFTAFRITKNKLVAEDLVQEAFLKLWQKRGEIIPDNLGGWLHKVVTHLAYKHQKKEARQRLAISSFSLDKQELGTDAVQLLIKKENNRIFCSILERLPEKQRLIYLLSREHGLRRNEIADLLNVSPNTVKVHLTRALHFVKENSISISLFTLFFLFNNIFSRNSNTFSPFQDSYSVQHTIERKLPEKQPMNAFLVMKLHF